MENSNNGHSREISPKQLRAIELLLAGMSDSEVAEKLNVNRSTIFRWKKDDPLFIATYNQFVDSINQASLKKEIEIRNLALEAMKELLKSKDDAVRLRAAKECLQLKNRYPGGPTSEEDVQSDLETAEAHKKSIKRLQTIMHR